MGLKHGLLWGREIWGPSSLYIQGPKTRPRSPIAEDDLTLNNSQNAWRKGQTQYRSRTREKAANTAVWSPASDRPLLQTMLFNLSQPPPTTRMYGLIGRVYTPKSKTYTWTLNGEENTSIKESQGGGDPRKEEKSYKRENGKDMMLLGLRPRT